MLKHRLPSKKNQRRVKNPLGYRCQIPKSVILPRLPVYRKALHLGACFVLSLTIARNYLQEQTNDLQMQAELMAKDNCMGVYDVCGTMIAARTPTEHHRLTLFAASQHPCSHDRAYKSFGHTIRLDSCIVHACFFFFCFPSLLHCTRFPVAGGRKRRSGGRKTYPKTFTCVARPEQCACLVWSIFRLHARALISFPRGRGPHAKKKKTVSAELPPPSKGADKNSLTLCYP